MTLEQRREKKIPTIGATFNDLWRELTTTFRHERGVYLQSPDLKRYGAMLMDHGGMDLVKLEFAKGYHGMQPFSFSKINDTEYNEVEEDFNKGHISVYWLRASEKIELHRATGEKIG
jgi:hypothetical protein